MTIYQLGNKKIQRHVETWIANNAIVIGDITLKENSSVWFGAVLRGDIENIEVGAGSNIQDNCVLHTDAGFPLTVGKGVTVGHLAMLHGCSIGDDSLVGIGATILNGSKIGKNCIIGANSLIAENKNIPDRSLVIGSPGKVIRQVTDEDIIAIKENALRYVNNWKNFKQNLKNN